MTITSPPSRAACVNDRTGHGVPVTSRVCAARPSDEKSCRQALRQVGTNLRQGVGHQLVGRTGEVPDSDSAILRMRGRRAQCARSRRGSFISGITGIAICQSGGSRALRSANRHSPARCPTQDIWSLADTGVANICVLRRPRVMHLITCSLADSSLASDGSRPCNTSPRLVDAPLQGRVQASA